MEGELAGHLLEEKSRGSTNRRNGPVSKTLKTGYGNVEIESIR
ncbi:MAG: hypothetical protein ACI9XO_004340, partial [Paraglaciecola sp.]